MAFLPSIVVSSLSITIVVLACLVPLSHSDVQREEVTYPRIAVLSHPLPSSPSSSSPSFSSSSTSSSFSSSAKKFSSLVHNLHRVNIHSTLFHKAEEEEEEEEEGDALDIDHDATEYAQLHHFRHRLEIPRHNSPIAHHQHHYRHDDVLNDDGVVNVDVMKKRQRRHDHNDDHDHYESAESNRVKVVDHVNPLHLSPPLLSGSSSPSSASSSSSSAASASSSSSSSSRSSSSSSSSSRSSSSSSSPSSSSSSSSQSSPPPLDGSYYSYSPLYGNTDFMGLYYAQVSVGTPAQKYFVQLDTGSSDLLIYADGCDNCGKPYNPRDRIFYNATASSTSLPVSCNTTEYYCDKDCWNGNGFNGTCAFKDVYEDGSKTAGPVLYETLSMGEGESNYTIDNITMGAIINTMEYFEPSGVSGIFGLTYAPVSAWGSPSALILLLNSTASLANRFSFCMRPEGGAFQIGKGDYEDEEFQWTPITKDVYYDVDIVDMRIGGVSLNSTSGAWGKPIVDSGTTLIYIAPKTFLQFGQYLLDWANTTGIVPVKAIQSMLKHGGGACTKHIANDTLSSFPPFEFILANNVRLNLTGDQYILPWYSGQHCLGIANGGRRDTIIGEVLMQNYHVVFDLDGNRIGFGDQNTTCPRSHALPDIHYDYSSSSSRGDGAGGGGMLGWVTHAVKKYLDD